MSDPANKTIYRNVLLSLLVLTGITVWVSQIDLGGVGNIVVGLLIAVIKASLVVLFFMHLKYEARWWAGLVIFPLVLVMIIIFSNLPDTGLNKDFTTPAEKQIKHAGESAPH